MTARRILLVDDDESIREVAQLALELVGGWLVSTAKSGREGLAKARAELPDAVLLDVMMPDMDGPTAFAHMHADPTVRDVPVILLTAKVRRADQQQWADLDVAGVIAKPFDPMRLSDTVARILGWRE